MNRPGFAGLWLSLWFGVWEGGPGYEVLQLVFVGGHAFVADFRSNAGERVHDLGA